MSHAPQQPEPTVSRGRAARWAASLLLVGALMFAAGWWFTGRRVWTDDATIRRAVDKAELREVLWTRPQPLADAFNTENQEYEPSVSPDGTEVYFVRGKPGRNADLYVSRRVGGAWLEPAPLASVNTGADELGPRLTPDGRFLLFYSDRAGGLGQYDIWAARRLPGAAGETAAADGARETKHTGGTAGAGGADGASETKHTGGTAGAGGAEHAGRTEHAGEAERADGAADAGGTEASPQTAGAGEHAAATDGAAQRAIARDPAGEGDAGIAFGEPFNLGPAVNSEFNEYGPAPTPDGTGLLFASNRKSARSEQQEPWRATIRQNESGDYDIFLAKLDASATPAVPAMLAGVFPPLRGAASDVRSSTQPATAPSTRPLDVAARPAGESGGVLAKEPNAPGAEAPSSQPSPGAGGSEDDSPTLAYQTAQELPGVNTPFHDGASCMSPAGDFLYFTSNRPGGQGKFDLYRGRLKEGVVSAVENLGPAINTPDNESDPQLAAGGFYLMFSSDGPGTRGGYDLLTAESREVYARRDGRPLPAIGWSWWLLLLALAALLPLLFFLRGWDDRRLNLLQKCLLVSLLFHVLLTVLFSLYNVSREIVQYVKRQQEMELAVDLRGADAETMIASAIREQPRLDVPVQAPAPVEVAQSPTDLPLETLEPLDTGAELTVPQAQVDPGRMVVEVPAPRMEAARASEMLQVPTPQPPAQLPDIDIAPPQAQVSAPEVAPADAPMTAPELDRQEVAAPAAPAPDAVVQLDVRPTDLEIDSLAPPTELPPVDRPADAEMVAAVPPAPGAQPDVETTVPDRSQPVASDEAALPDAGETELELARQPADSGPAERAPPEPLEASVPAAAMRAESIASQAEIRPDAPPAAAEAVPAPSPAPQPDLNVQPTVAAGKPAPVSSDEPAAPEAMAEADAGVSRQGVEVAVVGPAAVSPDVPAAQEARARDSLATAPEIKPEADSTPTAVPVPVEAAVTADRIEFEIKAVMDRIAARPAPDSAAQTQPTLPAAGRMAADDGEAVEAREVAVAAAPAEPSQVPGAAGALELPAGPTTRPSVVESADAALPTQAAMLPDVAPSGLQTARAGGGPEPELRTTEGAVTGEKLAAGMAGEAPAQAAAVEAGVPAAEAGPADAGESLASAAGATPRMVADDGSSRAPESLVIEAPDVSLPAGGAAGPKVASADHPADAEPATDKAVMLSVRAEVEPEVGGPAQLDIAPAINPAGQPVEAAKPVDALASAEVMPRADVVDVSVGPQLAVTLPELSAPEAMFQRSTVERRPLVEKMGGTQQSEEAVERGLAYLARQQEPDGRWTRVDDEGPPGKRSKGPHDMACTGLSVLAFLAADHTPAKAGPYSGVVENGLDFLLANQGADGDLRGYPDRRGGGSGAANMYDHGIACLALGEAGIMTGDKRYIDAALKGAAFICASQHAGTGGWRYVPGEPGDTSVFGWQIMALHSAEQLGFEIPAATRDGAMRYVDIASSGERKMLGGYTPGAGPTFAMTAEMLFARILLGHRFDDAELREVSEYLLRDPAQRGGDLYGWYYASLSLIQLDDDAWRTWNERCRQTLVTTQRLRGPLDGSWDTNLKWGDHGGRIYTTALATLTLEVYYRYLPMLQKK